MQFSLQHLLYLTSLVAAQLMLRSYWISTGVPANAAMISLSLAAIIAFYLGWTRHRILHAGLLAGATAMLSALAIATEVMFGSTATNFIPVDQKGMLPNLVALVVISIAGVVLGTFLAYLSCLIRSWIASHDSYRMARIAAAAAVLSLLVLCCSPLRGVSDAHAKRVRSAMSQQQVEAILGPPNPLPDLRRKGESFWDAFTHFGRRYVRVHVIYDSDGIVLSADSDGSWTTRPWLYW
ncbi:hypothetical protein Pla52o_57190 [Novipirellula galeiformis]|uniref:Uncharacterized protein n=1 Tax=Novipirellula galeiformis TaxID=2528004 RepID=A0A5C6BDS5_9BACT|nr:hypothetical protein [Novipirellula galeiformis]TWU10345.1 hypothetical protein Pla52o_57190 [Novipirellula galeiformis]